MAACISFTSLRDRIYRTSFSNAGLRSSTADLGDGTVIHSWVPRKVKPHNPSLVLIHGFGANAMWQWDEFVAKFSPRFNVYVPDMIFFGDSYTTCADRSEGFQARCLMEALRKWGVGRLSVVGVSYGGFVAYSLAAQFGEEVERVVLVCAGVCLEEKDVEDGMFVVNNVDEASSILMPQRAEKLRELLKLSFYRPMKNVPACFLNDFINVMCKENLQERKELIDTLLKGRKLSQLPKIHQPTLVIWGEHDQIFPLELAHRLVSYLDGKPELVVIKKAGHAVNVEKPKKMYKHIKAFLGDTATPSKVESSDNGNKTDPTKMSE
uniref:AB hydrolase-1 domain-containing protein n=1 Tax=Kalanchoe fedtschenkoi TaxID=63787 RepID=A0A7N0ZUK6_KALFE